MSLELRKEIQAEKTNVEASTYGTPYISGLEEDASIKEREKKYRRNSQRGGGKSRVWCQGSQIVFQEEGSSQQC